MPRHFFDTLNLLAEINFIPPERIWCTADLHTYHKNVITLEKRSFISLDDMHDTFIRNHNSLVRPDDLVIVCGDLSLGGVGRTGEFVEELNGHLILVRGNHDKLSLEQYQSIDVVCLPFLHYRNYLFTHVPVSSESEVLADVGGRHKDSGERVMEMWSTAKTEFTKVSNCISIHGHTHGKKIEYIPWCTRHFDVGIDTAEGRYEPYRLSNIVV